MKVLARRASPDVQSFRRSLGGLVQFQKVDELLTPPLADVARRSIFSFNARYLERVTAGAVSVIT